MPHPDTVRAPIEREHATTRLAREEQYVTDKKALEDDFHADLATIETARRADLVAAGLNPDGSSSGQLEANDPINTVAPAITGGGTTGDLMTCSTGTWVGADSYTYQWVRNGVAIGGATANTRTLVLADEGTSLKCVVTAHSEDSTTSKDSNTITPAP